MELTQKQIEQIKEIYPSGTKVECIRMDDPYYAIPSGMMGIVDHVDDTGTIHMQWANGSSPVSYTHLTLPTSVLMCRSRWSPYH